MTRVETYSATNGGICLDQDIILRTCFGDLVLEDVRREEAQLHLRNVNLCDLGRLAHRLSGAFRQRNAT